MAFDLWSEVTKSQRKDSNGQRLEAFFARPLERTPFDQDDAQAARTLRAELETAGTPIGAHDVLLAGQARRRGAILVASDPKELDRIEDGRMPWKQAFEESDVRFSRDLAAAADTMPNVGRDGVLVEEKRSKRGSDRVRRFGRYGVFLGCGAYRDKSPATTPAI